MLGHLARGLSLALVDGDWELAAMRRRVQHALGLKPRWLTPLLRRLLQQFSSAPIEADELAAYLYDDRGFRDAVDKSEPPLRIRRWFTPPIATPKVTGAPARFAVPTLSSEAEAADFFGLTVGELSWFADRLQLNRRSSEQRLRHYGHRWIDKRSGGYRLLETPKHRLKSIQRRLLRDVVSAIPPSAHAHGFVQGRSVHTFAAPHIGQRVVVRLDLQDFFAAISHTRIAAIFRRVGYPRFVAATLAALATTATPDDVLADCPTRPVGSLSPSSASSIAAQFYANSRLRSAHLPQGAPTSPALSNLVALALDRRLAGLANKSGATYTRYADDLVFSGGAELARNLTHLIHRAGAVALDEGLEVNYRKTRVMRSGRRQQIGGLVVNQRANVRRRDYDVLRATLHNAAKFGLQSQNRDNHSDFRAHLEGRVAWVAASNPGRGNRLKALLKQVPD